MLFSGQTALAHVIERAFLLIGIVSMEMNTPGIVSMEMNTPNCKQWITILTRSSGWTLPLVSQQNVSIVDSMLMVVSKLQMSQSIVYNMFDNMMGTLTIFWDADAVIKEFDMFTK